MYRLLALVALTSIAHANAGRERPPHADPAPPCTCIAKHALDYEVVPGHKLTLFESQTITNLDSAHNSHFANCMREHAAIEFTLELTFKANVSVPTLVRAKGPAPLIKCIEAGRWTFFGPPDHDTTLRYRIADHYAVEKQRREASSTAR